MIKKIILPVALMIIMTSSVQAVDLIGSLGTHDPSRIMKDGNRYWFFSTGVGIGATYSNNLTGWYSSNKTIFTLGTWPSWVTAAVPGFAGTFWAPDVIYMNNAYYLYYSCSTFGSSRSAIGVAKSASLNDSAWTDLGMVVSSDGSSTAINAIDPGLFKDDDGKVYMVYGSWFGGIGMVEIDSVTGMATTGTKHLYGGSHQSIEAANLIKEGDYYYLIVNRGICCQGVKSTYYITVGRADSVQGPYTGWNTLLSTSDRYIGPGHFSPLYDSCATYASIHYYDKNANGASKLDILRLTFVDGWPRLSRGFTFANCGASDIEIYSVSDKDQFLNIFPNPAENSLFSVKLPDEFMHETVTLEICSLDGKQLYSKKYSAVQSIQPDLSLRKGIYMVKVKNGNKVYTQKLAIQ